MEWLIIFGAYFLITLPFSIILTRAGAKRTIGAGGAFFITFLFSPLVGLVAVILSEKNDSTSGKLSSLQYLEQLHKLKALQSEGVLTEKEFEIEKQKLFELQYTSDIEESSWSWLKYPIITYGICLFLIFLFVMKMIDRGNRDAKGEYIKERGTEINDNYKPNEDEYIPGVGYLPKGSYHTKPTTSTSDNSTQLKDSKPNNEYFTSFYNEFVSDKQYQFKRIKFSLAGGFYDDTSDSLKHWTIENWKIIERSQAANRVPDGDINSNVVLLKNTDRNGNIVSEERYELINGLWYLVSYNISIHD
jgi:hypothetical protein